MRSSICLTAVATAFTLAYAQHLDTRQAVWQPGQTVPTTSGPVTGREADDKSGVSEYLGIPFANPPVGNLRFAAPVRFNGTAPVNATQISPSCYVSPSSAAEPTLDQLLKANLTAQTQVVQKIFTDPNILSEDCLYLNVWTKPQVGEKKKAVLVWIYGGAFTFGSTAVPAYNGRNLAATEDVVVVSVNYRTNIFGFPAHPNGTYNAGILDQRAGLEWVQDNIEQFGGDKTRITLFGQSAGSASVDYHTYAFASNPIMSSAILQSGTAYSWGLPNSQSRANIAWFATSQKLGCGDATSPPDSVLSCMRTKSPQEIYAAYPTGQAGSILGPFVPTEDNIVLFANYTNRQPANIPMLIGNNHYEGGLFRTEFSVTGLVLPDTFWTDFNLQEFTCPCSYRVNASLATKAPLWRYRYMGDFSNLAISPYSGSYHGAEIPQIFNVMPETSPPTSDEISVGNYMRKAWTKFAKDPSKGLSDYGWPLYDPTKDTLVRIAYNQTDGPNLIRPYRYDADCPFVNVSSTDPSKFGAFPDLGADIEPTASVNSLPKPTAVDKTEPDQASTSSSMANSKVSVSPIILSLSAAGLALILNSLTPY